ncbi:MAG: hypothetical protein MRY83_23550 [Flavobacteriales bacterium]|nr:hypothetical protein [Flavobacteriales bacterium]
MKLLSKSIHKKAPFIVFWGIILISVFYNAYYQDRNVIEHDVKSYYSYLPAIFIYQDLSFDYLNANTEQNKNYWLEGGVDGTKKYPKMTAGAAILYAPFFLVGHTFACVFGSETDGFSKPYRVALSWSSLLYFLLCGLYALKFFAKRYDPYSVSLSLLGVFLGTNFFYYLSHESAMTHVYSCSLLMVIVVKVLKGPRASFLRDQLLFGLIIGLLLLIRPTNAVPIGFVALLALYKGWDFKSLLLSTPWIFLVLCVQFILWKTMLGTFWVYSYGDERFFWLSPKVFEVMFSFRKGWLVYSPVLVFALSGVLFLKPKTRNLFICAGLCFLYVIACWWCWWYGGSFGNRAFIEVYGILIFPMMYFIDKVLRLQRFPRYVIIVGFFALICLNLIQTHQYVHKVIHWDAMTFDAYKGTFLKFHRPENYDALIKNPDYEAAKKGMR